jgi:hypothetical protein
MTMGERKDFVKIRLTEEAVAAHGGRVFIAAGRMHYEFIGREPVEVLTSQFRDVLSTEKLNGVLLFEVATDPSPASTATNEETH